MSEYMWGISHQKPPRTAAKKMDKICKEEGGYGYTEANVKEGVTPGINHGRYQGWFCGPNKGNPFDQHLATRVDERVAKECKWGHMKSPFINICRIRATPQWRDTVWHEFKAKCLRLSAAKGEPVHPNDRMKRLIELDAQGYFDPKPHGGAE